MFGVYRHIHTLRNGISQNLPEIKWSAVTGRRQNNDNSVTLAKELLTQAGYKFERDYFSFPRMSRVLVYTKGSSKTK
jgi:hypothetical protein